MLNYDLEKRGKAPIYEYLYRCIREDILAGVIPAGGKLPSKREMARDHHIALITVENAYAQLLIEGYIYSKEKSGYYVNTGGVLAESEVINRMRREKNPDDETVRGKKDADQYIEQPVGAEKSRETPGNRRADFTSNHAEGGAFPFSVWTKLLRRVLDDREKELLMKPDAAGVWELRQAIALYLKKAKGLITDPSCIIVGPGTEYLHHVVLQLIGHNRLVAVEDPGYKKVGLLYENNGLKCMHIPVDEKGLCVEKLLESNVSLVHISPSHHFPTGCVMPIQRRQELIQWASRQNAYIVEDDYDSEFRLEGRPVPTLAEMDSDQVIYMNTFSKTLTPSIRMAYMVLPEKLKELYERKLYFYSSAVSSFEQYTLAAFIREGYYERHISRMKNCYRQYRARFLRELAGSRLARLSDVKEADAGLHFILQVTKNIDDERFLEELEKEGIRMLPVEQYCYRNPEKYRHQFILQYSDISGEVLAECFDRMADLIEGKILQEKGQKNTLKNEGKILHV